MKLVTAVVKPHMLDAVKEALDAAGIADETLVIATTDHGLALPWMKCTLTDAGTGVLLIACVLYLPGGLASLRWATFGQWRDDARAWWDERAKAWRERGRGSATNPGSIATRGASGAASNAVRAEGPA